MAEDKETGSREDQGFSQVPRPTDQLAQPQDDLSLHLPGLKIMEPAIGLLWGVVEWGAGHIEKSLMCPLQPALGHKAPWLTVGGTHLGLRGSFHLERVAATPN